MLRKISLFILFLAIVAVAQAQSDLNPCGTVDHRSEWLQKFQRNSGLVNTRCGEKLYVPLTVHIVTNDDGRWF